jgi:hypothetical protein
MIKIERRTESGSHLCVKIERIFTEDHASRVDEERQVHDDRVMFLTVDCQYRVMMARVVILTVTAKSCIILAIGPQSISIEVGISPSLKDVSSQSNHII